jgi:Amt family ammonium transporter
VSYAAGLTAALAGVLLLGARKGKYGPNGQVNYQVLTCQAAGAFILWIRLV